MVALDPATVSDTLGVLLKYQDDIARLEGSKVKELLDEVKSELRAANNKIRSFPRQRNSVWSPPARRRLRAEMTEEQGRLAENIVYFARALRAPAFRSAPARCSTHSRR